MRLRHRIGGYREFDADAAAQSFCDAYWTHRTPPGPAVDGAAHRVLPDPAVSVAFWCIGRDARGLPLDSGVIVVGAKTRPQLFPLTPALELAAVRLKIEWVAPMLGIDPAAVDDQLVDFAAVRPRLAGALHAALLRTRTTEEALPVILRTIDASRVSSFAPAPAASAALDIVRRSAGRLRCEDVAERVGVSMRHLRRQVADAAGVSTRTYRRQLRLVHSMTLADRCHAPDWAAIALESGYCDQSHMIRECQALTGIAPSALHRERERQQVSERSNTP